MEEFDDDLEHFEAHGAAPLPVAGVQGYVEHEGARIWYAAYGSGSPVILLHGGLGHSGNWGYQVPMLVSLGHRAVLIDSRGHGRSTRAATPFTYELMASDVLAVMDALRIDKAAVVGWSDGACTALILAMQAPAVSQASSSLLATWIQAVSGRPCPVPFSTGVFAGTPGTMPSCRPRRTNSTPLWTLSA
jgi:pimeloyl-ACP methyl ester carboxylesterase